MSRTTAIFALSILSACQSDLSVPDGDIPEGMGDYCASAITPVSDPDEALPVGASVNELLAALAGFGAVTATLAPDPDGKWPGDPATLPAAMDFTLVPGEVISAESLEISESVMGSGAVQCLAGPLVRIVFEAQLTSSVVGAGAGQLRLSARSDQMDEMWLLGDLTLEAPPDWAWAAVAADGQPEMSFQGVYEKAGRVEDTWLNPRGVLSGTVPQGSSVYFEGVNDQAP
jgi:hypothetical protein